MESWDSLWDRLLANEGPQDRLIRAGDDVSADQFAIGAGRLISSQLYGVSSWDPVALSVAAGALAFSAFVAAMIPARRAASISPMKALRTE